MVDLYPQPIQPKQVTVTYEYVHRLIGQIIAPLTIRQILEALGMSILNETAEEFDRGSAYDKPTSCDWQTSWRNPSAFMASTCAAPAQSEAAWCVASSLIRRRSKMPSATSCSQWLLMKSWDFSAFAVDFYRRHPAKEESELVLVNNTSNVRLDITRPTMLSVAWR